MSSACRIILIEDNREYRDAIEFAVDGEADLDIVSAFSSAELVLKSLESNIATKEPDIVLLDLNLPGISGLEAIPYLRDCLPDSKIIVLSQSDSEADVLRAMTLGCSGYLLKSSTVDQIKDGIRTVIEGGKTLDPFIANYIIKVLQTRPLRAVASRLLSGRESEVLELLADGLQKKEIANQLNISSLTVDSHVRHIYEKLDANNAPAAVSKAYQIGIL